MRTYIIALLIVGLFSAIAIAYPTLADGVGVYTITIHGNGTYTITGDGNGTNIITEFDEIYKTALTSPFQAVSREIGDDNICQFYRRLIGKIGLDEEVEFENDSILSPYAKINNP